jgi:hypothetical protein
MLLYGLKVTQTSQQNLFGVKCGHCNTQGSTEMCTFSKYLHVLRIPFFPVKKVAITQCNRCRQVCSKKNFSPDLQHRFNQMKSNIVTPYWQFTGIVLIFILAAMVLYKYVG